MSALGFGLVKSIVDAVSDEVHKFMWTWTVATQGAVAAERWRRP